MSNSTFKVGDLSRIFWDQYPQITTISRNPEGFLVYHDGGDEKAMRKFLKEKEEAGNIPEDLNVQFVDTGPNALAAAETLASECDLSPVQDRLMQEYPEEILGVGGEITDGVLRVLCVSDATDAMRETADALLREGHLPTGTTIEFLPIGGATTAVE